MDTELLIETFPRLYHMAHSNAWKGIQQHGLLSTTALLDLFEVTGAKRHEIESTRRRDCVAIEHPIHGRAVIRDNKPMDEVGLRRALHGVSPREWLELLNRKVFFWLTEDRVETLLSANAYRHDEHCVLTLRTAALVENYYDQICLCPMNSGCTKPFPHPRDRGIFYRIADYPFEYWRRKKAGAKKAIVELAVDYSVFDIFKYVELVTVRNCHGAVHELWKI